MNLASWLFLLTLVAAVAWLVIGLGAHIRYRRCRLLRPAVAGVSNARGLTRVSVIVPARNEEANLEQAMQSVLAQRGVQLELIVVNDHSVDGTGRIADRLAAQDSRVRVVHNPPLPVGWLGKANAMHQGSQCATGDFIVFTDADIVHAPGTIAAALAEMHENGHTLLSLLPRFRWVGLWENAVAPAFLLAVAHYLRAAVHDAHSREAVAIGAFIMVDIRVYRRLGGHAAVCNEMLDDVMLARRFKLAGEPVAFLAAPQYLSVRMYRGARAVFLGSIKNCLAIFGRNLGLALPLSALFALGSVCVLFAPFYGFWAGEGWLLTLGICVYFEVWLAVFLSRAYVRCDLLRLAGFWCGAPLLAGAALVAMYQALFHGAVLWRGRAIRVAGYDWAWSWRRRSGRVQRRRWSLSGPIARWGSSARPVVLGSTALVRWQEDLE